MHGIYERVDFADPDLGDALVEECASALAYRPVRDGNRFLSAPELAAALQNDPLSNARARYLSMGGSSAALDESSAAVEPGAQSAKPEGGGSCRGTDNAEAAGGSGAVSRNARAREKATRVQ